MGDILKKILARKVEEIRDRSARVSPRQVVARECVVRIGDVADGARARKALCVEAGHSVRVQLKVSRGGGSAPGLLKKT